MMGRGEISDKERIAELADAFNKVCAENADFVAQSVTDENRIAQLETDLKDLYEDIKRLTDEAYKREEQLAAVTAERDGLRRDADRYMWLYPHYEVVHLLKIKAPSIPCPDKLKYCATAHYGPVTKAMIDIAIDAAIAQIEEGK
jgi:hypothetical protein